MLSHSHLSSVTGTRAGKWAYFLNMAINAATFALAPQTPLRDTFPELQDGTETLAFGLLLMEVIAYLSYQLAAITLMGNGIKGFALGLSPGLAVLYKHVVINKSGPPLPIIVLMIVTTLLLVKDAFLSGAPRKGGSKKAE